MNEVSAAWSGAKVGDHFVLRVAKGRPCWSGCAVHTDEVAPLVQQASELAERGLVLVGFLAYEAAPAFDSVMVVQPTPQSGDCGQYLAYWAAFESDQISDLPCRSAQAQAWCSPWQETASPDWYNASFQSVKQFIEQGELYQLNLTTRLQAQADPALDPWVLFQQLFASQPTALSVYLDTGVSQILSLSPELFFQWDGSRVLTSPMKGTRNPLADGEALQDSTKDRAENVMIVDLLRNDLARVCEPGSVQVRSLFEVMKLPTVEQMTSTIEGKTRPGVGLVDLLRALFPCGSITGAPKQQAMRRIADLENAPRGVYCGALGVMGPGSAVQLNVPIRTLSIQDDVLTYGVGSGLTWYSDQVEERKEWWQKTEFLRQATCDFQILETLRLQEGQWVRQEAHLARMRNAAKHFGFVWQEHVVHKAMQQAARGHANGRYRGRLLLHVSGRLEVQVLDLPELPKRIVLQLAPEPFETQGQWVGFKTTNRSHYDSVAPTCTTLFDTLLYDRTGAITETCRFNLVAKKQNRLMTPQNNEIGCESLLNGVFRASLLGDNVVQESRLSVFDLPRFSQIWLINSLREWVEVHEVQDAQGQLVYTSQQ